MYHQSDGKKIIEVQFDFEDIAIPEHLKTEKLEKNSILQTLILFPKSGGSYVPYFLNIYPDSPDKKFKLKDFMDGGYQKIQSDFSGIYRFYRWNGDFISGWRIKDGIKTHRIKESKAKGSNKNSRLASSTLVCYQVVTTWYKSTCWEGFGCTTPVEDGTTVSGYECELVMAPPTPGDTGGGGGGGGTPPSTGTECEQPEGNLQGVTVECDEDEEEEEVFTIENNVQNICIRGPVQQAITQDFKTQISDIIQSCFAQSENVNITIIDVDNLADDIDGTHDGSGSGGFWNLTIKLNRNILQNASKEYILATVFHEFLHAYFAIVLDEDMQGDTPEHRLMASQYLDALAQSLVNIYGIGMNEAKSLSWGGLKETVEFSRVPHFIKYGADGTGNTSGIFYENKMHRTGQKGKKCAPL